MSELFIGIDPGQINQGVAIIDKNLKVICAHVNHKVRKESDEEAKMVEKFATDNNNIFELYEITKYHDKANFHEDARKIRYKFLKELKDNIRLIIY